MGKVIHLSQWRKSVPDSTQEMIVHLLDKALPLSGEEAIAIYLECIRLDPKGPEAYLNLGVELTRKNEIKQARKHLRKAIKLSPNCIEAHYNLGHTYLNKTRTAHDDTQAVKHFTRALELASSAEWQGNVLYNLGQAYLHLDKRRAWNCYQRYLRVEPQGQGADDARKILDHISARSPQYAPKERVLTLVR